MHGGRLCPGAVESNVEIASAAMSRSNSASHFPNLPLQGNKAAMITWLSWPKTALEERLEGINDRENQKDL